MPNIRGSFRVTKVYVSKPNIQYAAVFLEDSVLLLKIGKQFTHRSYRLTLLIPILIFAAGAVFGLRWALLAATLAVSTGRLMQRRMFGPTAGQREETRLVALLDHATPEELVRADSENFRIFYGDMASMEARRAWIGLSGPRSGTLAVSLKHGSQIHKFDIAPYQNFDDCQRIISAASGKIPDAYGRPGDAQGANS